MTELDQVTPADPADPDTTGPVEPGADETTAAVAGSKPAVSRTDQIVEIVGKVAIAVFFVAIFVTVFFTDPDVPSDNKVRAAITGAAVIGVAVIVALPPLRKRFSVLAWFTDVLMLLVVVAGVLIPVLALDRRDQIVLLKLAVAVILAVVPAAIYLQFIASRGITLWEEFVETLRRLNVDTFGELPARDEIPPPTDVYRRRFEATYGRLGSPDRLHHGPRGRAFMPIVALTLICGIGWVAVLQPEPVSGTRLFSGDWELSGAPAVSIVALHFGFAGAYFFIVQMLVRRYFQNDLKSDAFINAIQRVIAVALIVATLSYVWDGGPALAAVAFMIGLFPQLGLDVLRVFVAKAVRSQVPSLRSRHPLDQLDGMNVWYESRLLEEGIEDQQNLATAGWLNLILNTRIPPGRLVDWVDQAHLLLRVDENERARLRGFGIRTATDLEQVVGPLGTESTGTGTLPTDAIVSLLTTLRYEPTLHNVRSWKGRAGPDAAPLPAVEHVEETDGAGVRAAAGERHLAIAAASPP
jgi:hypothetical protein